MRFADDVCFTIATVRIMGLQFNDLNRMATTYSKSEIETGVNADGVMSSKTRRNIKSYLDTKQKQHYEQRQANSQAEQLLKNIPEGNVTTSSRNTKRSSNQVDQY